MNLELSPKTQKNTGRIENQWKNQDHPALRTAKLLRSVRETSRYLDSSKRSSTGIGKKNFQEGKRKNFKRKSVSLLIIIITITINMC